MKVPQTTAAAAVVIAFLTAHGTADGFTKLGRITIVTIDIARFS